ncbi:6489_t:CDS:2, partial [Racocetra persica]
INFASYNIDVQTTNLKNHYAKHHQKEYQTILATEEAKRNQVKKTNLKEKNIGQFFASLFENSLVIQQSIQQQQIEKINEAQDEDYFTEEEEIEVVQTSIPLTKKKKN